jgi:hypothetical protein
VLAGARPKARAPSRRDGAIRSTIPTLRWGERVLDRTTGRVWRNLPWHKPRATAHEILGVDVDASSDTIRRAYVKLVRQWHPDNFTYSPTLRREAEVATKRINEAYEALIRPGDARLKSERRLHRHPRYLDRPVRAAGPADVDRLLDSRTPSQQVMVVLLTILIWGLTTLLLIVIIALWLGQIR